MARLAGFLVVAAFFAGLFATSASKYGVASAMIQWVSAIALAALIGWAVGAVVTGDWLPFRDL